MTNEKTFIAQPLEKVVSKIKKIFDGELYYLLEEFKRTYFYKNRRLNSTRYPNISAIEITNFCNLKCIMCPHRYMTREKQHMKFELFKKIIGDIKNYPQGLIWLHVFGEPLMHPQVLKFIKYAKKYRLKIGISTNCILLNKNMSEELLKTSLDVIVMCIDASTKKTYEKLRVGSNWETVFNNIMYFLKLKKKMRLKKPYTIVQFIKNKYNQKEIKAFRNQWRGLADKVDVKVYDEWGSQIKNINKLSESKHRKERHPCEYLWHNLNIHSDGNVSICCVDYNKKISLGNVKNQKLIDIWNGNKLRELRELQINNNFNNGLCNVCEQWKGSPKNKLYPLEKPIL